MGSKGARKVAGAAHAGALIDTDVLIDAARAHPDAVAFLSGQHQASRVQVSIISAMELIVGSRNKVELRETTRFLQPTRILPIDSKVSQIAYSFYGEFHSKSWTNDSGRADCRYGQRERLTLVTKNTRHFQMIPGLKLNRPY